VCMCLKENKRELKISLSLSIESAEFTLYVCVCVCVIDIETVLRSAQQIQSGTKGEKKTVKDLFTLSLSLHTHTNTFIHTYAYAYTHLLPIGIVRGTVRLCVTMGRVAISLRFGCLG
jgi:hypothetical protein